MTTDDGLQLQSSSPCINVGNNTGVSLTDILTNNRVFNSIVDMGAYEFGSTPLPVTLISCIAKSENQTVKLFWSTANEFNAERFTIEKSKNATNWDVILNVAAVGNSITVQNYSATDKKPFEGNNYYRLKQIDINGTFTYSEIVSINIDNWFSIITFPNPTYNGIVSFINDNKNTFAEIFNLNGQLIKSFAIKEGENEFNLSNFSNGMYFMKIGPNTTKIVKSSH